MNAVNAFDAATGDLLWTSGFLAEPNTVVGGVLYAGMGTSLYALRAATANPARVVGAQKKGVLEPGADADFVVLTAEGEVRATVINGTLLQ